MSYLTLREIRNEFAPNMSDHQVTTLLKSADVEIVLRTYKVSTGSGWLQMVRKRCAKRDDVVRVFAAGVQIQGGGKNRRVRAADAIRKDLENPKPDDFQSRQDASLMRLAKKHCALFTAEEIHSRLPVTWPTAHRLAQRLLTN